MVWGNVTVSSDSANGTKVPTPEKQQNGAGVSTPLLYDKYGTKVPTPNNFFNGTEVPTLNNFFNGTKVPASI